MNERLSEEEHARWWKEAGGWQLRQLLYWRWDPIGVNIMFPWTYDEYDSYAGPVLEQLKEGAGFDEIAQYLRELAIGHMGMSGGPDVETAARQIVDWYPSSIDLWRERSR